MAGRRLTISSLLCRDEQSTDQSQASVAHSHPRPSQIHASLSGPGVPPAEHQESQVRNIAYPESHTSPYDSRAYSYYERDTQDVSSISTHTLLPPIDDILAHPELRKDITDDTLSRSEALTGNSGSLVSSVSHEQSFVSYHIPHHLPSVASRPVPSFRRSSDPSRPEYRSYEGIAYFSPPSTSRSARSEYLPSPSAYPLPAPLAKFDPSPQHSPIHRRPSQSPVRGISHPSDSPTSTFRHMSQSSSFSHPQGSQSPSQSPSQSHSQGHTIPPGNGALGHESATPRSVSHHTGPFSQIDAPSTAPRSSSVAALLNAEPVKSPITGMGMRGSVGDLGGLEALVEAATKERRRLSGELLTPLEIRETARRASMSPVLNRVPSSLPQPSLSPVIQRSPVLPSPRVDARVNSLAVIPLGSVTGHDGEPPTKRRRRTGSSGTTAPIVHSNAVPVATAPKSLPPITPTPYPSSHAAQSAQSTTGQAHSHPGSPQTSPDFTANVSTDANATPHQLPVRPTTPIKSLLAPTVRLTSISQLLSPEPYRDVPTMDDDIAAVRPTLPPSKGSSPPGPLHSLSADEIQLVQKSMDNLKAEAVDAVPCSRVISEVGVHPGEGGLGTMLSGIESEHLPVAVIAAEEQELSSKIVAKEEEENLPTPLVAAEEEESSTITVDAQGSIMPPTEEARNLPMQSGRGEGVPVPSVEEAQDLPMRPHEVEETLPILNSGLMEQVAVASQSIVTAHEETPLPIPGSGLRLPSEPSGSVVSVDDHALHRHVSPSMQVIERNREQDPHEWLLQQYSGDSPKHGSRRSSPAFEEPPATPDFSDTSPPSPPRAEAETETIKRVCTSSPARKPKIERVIKKSPSSSPFRSPDPTALLEQQLDGLSPDNDPPPTAVSPRSDADTDLALELDLAVSTTPDVCADPDVSMGNDLDDELLSLLDDQPRHSHSHHVTTIKASHISSNANQQENSTIVKASGSQKTLGVVAPPERPPATLPPSERVVMPPPIAFPASSTKPTGLQNTAHTDKLEIKGDKADSGTISASMKKESTPKPVPKDKEKEKMKQPAKPKPRPIVKPKGKTATKDKDNAVGPTGRLTPSASGTVLKGKKAAVANAAVASAAKRGASAAGPSRSRSASEMPTPSEPVPKPKPQLEEEESEEDAVDDKLYCICKTSYDEDRVMIACDRCDEWYHTQCLNMNDLEVDLIDQFVCPPCVTANPTLPLKTTYKQRCMAGVKHLHPMSPSACHKPSRDPFSKFCSDECGIVYMQRRIEGWGGDQAVLWASVRDAKAREGVVVKVQVLGAPNAVAKDEKRLGTTLGHLIQEAHGVQRPSKTQRERTIARLQAQLERIAPKREELKKDLEIVLWRQKLLRLAAARADRVDECGWDHRLCFDDEEWAEFGGGVLESYEGSRNQLGGGAETDMHIDDAPEDGGWWCRGKRKCQRHVGWQKLRASEFEFDQELKEKAILNLTTKEREIRKQMEDVISLPLRRPVISGPLLQPTIGHQSSNGIKAKPNGTSRKKGKQKN